MKLVLVLVLLSLVVFLVDRFLLWLEWRGWIDYRMTNPGRINVGQIGPAFLAIGSLLEPGKRYVVEEITSLRTELDEESGPDCPGTGSSIESSGLRGKNKIRAMKWRPSPAELVQTFDEVVPGPPAVRRKMFGYPAAFVNGNMFAGLFQDQVIVRLSEQERETLIQTGGTPFEPMGRPMREYAVVPNDVVGDRKAVSSWVQKAFAYGRSLPPKAPKETKRKAAARALSGTGETLSEIAASSLAGRQSRGRQAVSRHKELSSLRSNG